MHGNDRGERKATGSYYTPDYVVKYIVEANVDPLLHEAVEGAKSDGEMTDAVLALNVLDPSIGSGHLLVEVVERISRFLVEVAVAPEELEEGVTAIDIDSKASEMADLTFLEVEGQSISAREPRANRAIRKDKCELGDPEQAARELTGKHAPGPP